MSKTAARATLGFLVGGLLIAGMFAEADEDSLLPGAPLTLEFLATLGLIVACLAFVAGFIYLGVKALGDSDE